MSMAGGRPGAVGGDLVRIFDGDSVAGLDDGELLGRFADRGDEGAFEALVGRLGPMVLGVCRRMLADHHDVDDAFQATFLVLVKKAGSIRDRELIGPWLHGVATRTARRARASSARRAARERVAVVPEALEDDAGLEAQWPDLRALIDEEIGRLPEHHRRPVVLCDVEGLSREEAALRLGWTLNMVRGRLERARDRLRGRLARRGLAPSGAWMTLMVAPPAPSPALVAATSRAALGFAAGRLGTGLASASAVALSRGVLRMMMLSKLKLGLAVAVSAGFVAAGSGMIAAQGPGGAVATPPAKVADKADPAPGLSRVDMARKHLITQRTFYDAMRIGPKQLLDASQSLMDAELEAAATPGERKAAVRTHLDRVKEIERHEKAELEIGRSTNADVEEVQTRRLVTEFLLAKEDSGPATDARPANPTAVDTLARERIEMAQKRLDTQIAFYNEGRITIDRLLDASKTLMEAKLDAATSPAERKAAIRTHLDQIKVIEAREKEELEAGRATTADVLEAQTRRLDIEFRLAKEDAAAVTPVAPAAEVRLADPTVVDNLARERVEIARRLFADAKKLSDAGELPVVDLLKASTTLMEAERDAAGTKAGREAAIRALVDNLRKTVAMKEQMIKFGNAPRTEIDMARLRLLDAEIELAREAAGSGPSSVADLARRVAEVERKLDRILNLLDAPKR